MAMLRLRARSRQFARTQHLSRMSYAVLARSEAIKTLARDLEITSVLRASKDGSATTYFSTHNRMIVRNLILRVSGCRGARKTFQAGSVRCRHIIATNAAAATAKPTRNRGQWKGLGAPPLIILS